MELTEFCKSRSEPPRSFEETLSRRINPPSSARILLPEEEEASNSTDAVLTPNTRAAATKIVIFMTLKKKNCFVDGVNKLAFRINQSNQ
jgi:hypothetical protein